MSRVWTTPIDDAPVGRLYDEAAKMAHAVKSEAVALPWIHGDAETDAFIAYWIGKPQAAALRCWAYALHSLDATATPEDRAAIDVRRSMTLATPISGISIERRSGLIRATRAASTTLPED